MRCRHCKQRYSAACRQPSPGGSSAPGVFFVLAGAAVAAAVGSWLALGRIGWAIVGGAFALWMIALTAIAWFDCRGEQGGGEKCPRCGAANTVRPWSL